MNPPKKTYRNQSERIAAARDSRQKKAFERGLSALRVFIAREKKADVPVAHVEPVVGEDKGYRLGRWVANQRAKYHRGEMSQSDIKTLESFPGWSWSAWNKGWSKAIRLLRQFQEREGHPRCPINHKEKGFPLGEWVARQRLRYKSGSLSPDRALDLESFPGLLGNWKKAQSEELWEGKMEALRQFTLTHGHANVPRHHNEGGVGLGVWVNSVRSQHNKGVLSPERVAAVEAMPGWKWAQSREESREIGFNRLLAYVETYGHANVPRNYVDDTGYRVGEWVGKRRGEYKTGQLTESEIQCLEAVPGWVWALRRRNK